MPDVGSNNMGKPQLFTFIIAFLFFGCSNNYEHVDFGGFSLSLPKNNTVSSLKSVDSQAADIIAGTFKFRFDFGRYGPKLIQSEEEYFLENKAWQSLQEFVDITFISPYPKLKEVIKKNDSTYIAVLSGEGCLDTDSCMYYDYKESFKNLTTSGNDFLFRIPYPKYLKEFDFFIEKTDSTFTRIYIAKNNTTFGVYTVNYNYCEDEFNCWKQLSLWSIDTVHQDRSEILKILRSVKLK